ncbi:MAG: bacterial transferase hexapeptide family protein [Burkholderiales bacterium]|jgi:sugar O-acyltransferase (sialic acid O-acetyltransferase NeuD family)|nr:bacterial transferase hexapeptide family protein [Burkholderiales bacterium]
MKKVVIVGTGETADIAYEYLKYDSDYDVVAFSINEQYKNSDNYNELPLIALESLTQNFDIRQYKVFVAISSGKLNRNRQHVYELVKKYGYSCISYISSKAFVWRTAEIGENCFIFENNVIQHGVSIGNNTILWSGNHVGHQTIIREHVFVSSHCVISGFCEIGENSFLGVNCAIADNVKVGRDCFLGMGTVVTRNLADNVLIKSAKSEISAITAKQLCKVEE